MHKVVLHHTSELGSCKLAIPTETPLTLTLKVMIGMGEVHPFIYILFWMLDLMLSQHRSIPVMELHILDAVKTTMKVGHSVT